MRSDFLPPPNGDEPLFEMIDGLELVEVELLHIPDLWPAKRSERFKLHTAAAQRHLGSGSDLLGQGLPVMGSMCEHESRARCPLISWTRGWGSRRAFPPAMPALMRVPGCKWFEPNVLELLLAIVLRPKLRDIYLAMHIDDDWDTQLRAEIRHAGHAMHARCVCVCL